MPIDLTCPQCNKTLRVPDDAAGKQARCPECQQIFAIGKPGDPASPRPSSQDSWRVKIEDGRSYGPISKSELDQWVAEGRITPRTQLLREGTEHWKEATQFYPGLVASDRTASANPFADAEQPEASRANPYAAPTTQSRAGSWVAPHRGGLILAFGILSWLSCATCALIAPIFGVVAWVMGRSDLAAMDAGRMDPSGMGITRTGMLLGIVNCVLLLIVAVLYAVFQVVAIVGGM